MKVIIVPTAAYFPALIFNGVFFSPQVGQCLSGGISPGGFGLDIIQ